MRCASGRSGIVFNESFREMGLRSQVSGSVRIDIEEHIDRKVLRFMGDAAAYAYIAMQKAIEDAGLTRGSGIERAHGAHRFLRRRVQREHHRQFRHVARPRRAQDRPVHGAALDEQFRVRVPRDAVPHQGRQLFDHLGLRDERALHRRCRGTDPARQAGRNIRRRRRGGALEPHEHVRCDGRAVDQVQRSADARHRALTT